MISGKQFLIFCIITSEKSPMILIKWYDKTVELRKLWINRLEGFPQLQTCYSAKLKPGIFHGINEYRASFKMINN